MKTKLLISVAMAALIAGTAGALAQQEEKGGAPAGASAGCSAASDGAGWRWRRCDAWTDTGRGRTEPDEAARRRERAEIGSGWSG